MEAKLYKPTLYQQVREIESIDETIDGILRGLDNHSEIDVSELQRNLFRRYEENPVLYDAIKGKQTIGESLEELSQINRGIRKILPWRVNEGHNKRLKQLGELVPNTERLYTRGIFMPDNIIATIVEVIGIFFGSSYLMSKYLLRTNLELSPGELQEMVHFCRVTVPSLLSALTLPIGIGVNCSKRLNPSLPRDEAKYLDEKVTEFYK